MAPNTAETAETLLPKPAREWLSRHATIQNVLMVLVLASQGGQYWQKQQSTNEHLTNAVNAIEVRLQAAENTTLAHETTAAATFMRKDVIEVWLKAVDARLTAIETILRDRKN